MSTRINDRRGRELKKIFDSLLQSFGRVLSVECKTAIINEKIKRKYCTNKWQLV